ncbi:MAG TPA: LuxR C-terminal-related transcriptional regulator [Actinomycetota bacterium]|nr:LuxR C-terminal-related transcriptional regulator [Actinomycetota bacterium]
MSPRAVVVAHREPLVAEALATALATHPAVAAIGVASTAARALQVGAAADAVVLDELLEGAPEVADGLRRRGVRVVFLGEPDPEDEGIRVSPREPLTALVASLVPTALGNGGPDRLSPRERQVLDLAARGFAAKQVARILGISVKTVEHHKSRIFAKLGVPNQAAAVRLALVTRPSGRATWIRSST